MCAIKRMFQILSITAVIVTCIVSSQALAARLDGSATVICAFTIGAECDSTNGCVSVTPAELGLPQFFKVDFANKKIIVAGQTLETAATGTGITSVQRLDGQLILQGVEVRAWSMSIRETTGVMTLTASGDDEAFVLFGACTVP